MALNDYVAKEPRALPIFVLADISGSMSGEKINELNLALREMLNSLKSVDDIRGKFQLCIVGFGGSVKVVQELTDIGDITLNEMTASGNTPMGEAFDVIYDFIEDKEVVGSRAYAPTIVLVSDGHPTDCTVSRSEYSEWGPLKRLQTGSRTSKAQRLAMGIGGDADIEMLKAFINNLEIPLIKAKDASGIAAFFRWVTMSTVARMNSVNPNLPCVVAPVVDFDDEEIII